MSEASYLFDEIAILKEQQGRVSTERVSLKNFRGILFTEIEEFYLRLVRYSEVVQEWLPRVMIPRGYADDSAGVLKHHFIVEIDGRDLFEEVVHGKRV